MTNTVALSQAEIEQAITQYLAQRGLQAKDVALSHTGWPDSPDPREQAVDYSATATVTVFSPDMR